MKLCCMLYFPKIKSMCLTSQVTLKKKKMEQFNSSSQSQPSQERFCSLMSVYPSKAIIMSPPSLGCQDSCQIAMTIRKGRDARSFAYNEESNESFIPKRKGKESAHSPLASCAGSPGKGSAEGWGVGGDTESQPQVPTILQT